MSTATVMGVMGWTWTGKSYTFGLMCVPHWLMEYLVVSDRKGGRIEGKLSSPMFNKKYKRDCFFLYELTS